MGRLKINQEKINDESVEKLIKICPFNAIEYKNGILAVSYTHLDVYKRQPQWS